MKSEYDFSDGVRGKFANPLAISVPPVHLDEDILSILTKRAHAKGVDLNSLVNTLLRKDIELIEAAE